MAALRGELLTLREELAAYSARMPAIDDSSRPNAQLSAASLWRGIHLNGNRASDVTRRSAAR
jgi:hypothetical protein